MRLLTRHRRPGLLLPEALVTILIVGILLAVLIPGIHRARHAARRVNCLNNAKQIALALHIYHDAHSIFPPGYISRSLPDEPASTNEAGPGWAWGTMLLPSLDQGPTAATLDYSLDATGATLRLNVFLCRDDDPPAFGVTSPRLGTVTLPPSSYVGVFGFGSLTEAPGRPAGPGMFYRNSNVRQEDVLDGSSQTLLFGERRFSGAMQGAPPSNSTWLAVIPGASRQGGYRQTAPLEGPASLVLGTAGQDSPEPFVATPNSSRIISTFSSPHEGGAHFARVDGSVNFIRQSIDPLVFRQLAERENLVAPEY
jgi:type II secretory pathway pseudopilin PulG